MAGEIHNFDIAQLKDGDADAWLGLNALHIYKTQADHDAGENNFVISRDEVAENVAVLDLGGGNADLNTISEANDDKRKFQNQLYVKLIEHAGDDKRLDRYYKVSI